MSGNTSSADPLVQAVNEGRLIPGELWWTDRRDWLLSKGYRLRPRYQKDWIASWRRDPSKMAFFEEDGQVHFVNVDVWMDAVRISDGKLVVLKKFGHSPYSDELEVGRAFSEPPLDSHPHNHCVPILDVLKAPGDDTVYLMAIPLLYHVNSVPFETVGEIVGFIDQIILGINLMHEHRVSHCDIKLNNILMDSSTLYGSSALQPHPIDPTHTRDFTKWPKAIYNRTEKPVRYHIIDFDLSTRYGPEDTHPLKEPPFGGTRNVPEFRSNAPCNPFAVDIFCLGDMIKTSFFEGEWFGRPATGLGFMSRLIDDMMHPDPDKRPTMPIVLKRFNAIKRRLHWWTLRSRCYTRQDSSFSESVIHSVAHYLNQLRYIIYRVPAIPRSKSRYAYLE